MATRFPDRPPFTGFTAPMRVEADTTSLEVAQGDFRSALTSQIATAAHPKFDPVTGEMVFFGFAAKGETSPDIAYYEADPRYPPRTTSLLPRPFRSPS